MEYTVEVKEKQAQESEQEDSDSDDKLANTQRDSRQQTDTKSPSRIVQKNHPKIQKIGDKHKGVQTRRKLIKAS